MERIGEALARVRVRAVAPTGDAPAPAPEEAPSCPRCRGYGFVRHDVPLDHPDFGRAFPCECRAEQHRDRLRRRSNLGPLASKSFSSFQPDGRGGLSQQARQQLRAAFEIARTYADELTPPWLVLVGPAGCGKTHLAAAVANRRIEVGQEAFFAVVPDLLDHLRATFAPTADVSYDELFESVRGAPLLVLDDLGTQSGSAWAQEKLFQILNHRFNAALPTVVTTNHHLSDLDERLRARLEDSSIAFVAHVRNWDSPILEGLLEDWPEGLAAQRFDTFTNAAEGLTTDEKRSLRHAHQAAVDFAARPRGWLVLVGENGRGKTHLAAAIKNYRDEHDQPTLFMTVPDLLDYLRATYAPSSEVAYDRGFDVIKRAPVLVLDDYGAHSSTPWALEKLFQLLNYRFNARLPTVITTNLAVDREGSTSSSQQELRILSRLRAEGFSRVVRIEAPRFTRTSPRARATSPRGTSGERAGRTA